MSPRARRWLLLVVALVAADALLGRILSDADFMGALAEARRGHLALALAFAIAVALRLVVVLGVAPVCLAWSALVAHDALRAARRPTRGPAG